MTLKKALIMMLALAEDGAVNHVKIKLAPPEVFVLLLRTSSKNFRQD